MKKRYRIKTNNQELLISKQNEFDDKEKKERKEKVKKLLILEFY